MPITSDVYRKIVDAKVFIDEHFDSPIDLDTIAGEAFYGLKHFIMITKVSHISLFVLDQDKAYDFYVNKLGFKVHTD